MFSRICLFVHWCSGAGPSVLAITGYVLSLSSQDKFSFCLSAVHDWPNQLVLLTGATVAISSLSVAASAKITMLPLQWKRQPRYESAQTHEIFGHIRSLTTLFGRNVASLVDFSSLSPAAVVRLLREPFRISTPTASSASKRLLRSKLGPMAVAGKPCSLHHAVHAADTMAPCSMHPPPAAWCSADADAAFCTYAYTTHGLRATWATG